MITHEQLHIGTGHNPAERGNSAVSVAVDHIAEDIQKVFIPEMCFFEQAQEIIQRIAVKITRRVDHDSFLRFYDSIILQIAAAGNR